MIVCVKSASPTYYESLIKDVLNEILRQPEKRWTLGQFADRAGFSRYHFHRLFRFIMQEPIAEFTRRIRLERAAHELAQSEFSVVEISIRAGYSMPEAFTRAFRGAFGASPSDWRQSGRTVYYLPTPNAIHFDTTDISTSNLFFEESPMNIQIKPFGPMRLLCIRHIGPYHEIGSKFESVHQYAVSHGIEILGAVGVYRDDPQDVPMMELRSDAAVMVGPSVELTVLDGEIADGTVHGLEVPERTYAAATYFGTYDGLSRAWDEFIQAIVAGGHQMTEFCFEHYVTDCNLPPEKIQTDLYHSVKTD